MPPQGSPRHDSPRWPSESVLAKTLGTRLKTLRKEQGLSQRELAEHLRLAKSAIAAFESGRSLPSVTVVVGLAGALNAGVEALLGTTTGGPPPARDPQLMEFVREVSEMDPESRGYVLAILKAISTGYRTLFRRADPSAPKDTEPASR
jgi:transcriptional regulator with XRE-family HTH domain